MGEVGQLLGVSPMEPGDHFLMLLGPFGLFTLTSPVAVAQARMQQSARRGPPPGLQARGVCHVLGTLQKSR